ncbi:MAG: HAD-IA family hydrolase, partial [Treponema sp.]|nr:HAD-IA family hydrolase [Treponema sp.]
SDWSMEYMNESGVPEKKGAREILEFLKSEKIPVALATSSEKSFAEKLLEKANLIQYFDLMIFGDEVSRAKPDPEIYETSCRKLGLVPEKCVAVEDSPNGIKSAVSAGLKAVMVLDRIPADGDMKKLAWKISDSLLSLKKIMEEQ